VAVRRVPERLSWSVRVLAVDPADRLLEIGCGRGVAVALICPALREGAMTAVDRSPVATAAAAVRNAEHIAAGRAAIHTASLDALDLPGQRFGKIFAVNVSVFWVGPAARELAVIRGLLASGGAVYLCYEPPDPAKAAETGRRVTAALAASGFATTTVTGTTSYSTALLCVIGRPR
jgi:SAM-dependent methyltransferase